NALAFLSALRDGSDHPFWQYAEALRSEHGGRPPPNALEDAYRVYAVGWTRAVARAAKIRFGQATTIIVKPTAPYGLNLKTHDLRNWDRDFNGKSDSLPDDVAQKLVKTYGVGSVGTDLILNAGAETLKRMGAKPMRTRPRPELW